jgi:hypothetical protein
MPNLTDANNQETHVFQGSFFEIDANGDLALDSNGNAINVQKEIYYSVIPASQAGNKTGTNFFTGNVVAIGRFDSSSNGLSNNNTTGQNLIKGDATLDNAKDWCLRVPKAIQDKDNNDAPIQIETIRQSALMRNTSVNSMENNIKYLMWQGDHNDNPNRNTNNDVAIKTLPLYLHNDDNNAINKFKGTKWFIEPGQTYTQTPNGTMVLPPSFRVFRETGTRVAPAVKTNVLNQEMTGINSVTIMNSAFYDLMLTFFHGLTNVKFYDHAVINAPFEIIATGSAITVSEINDGAINFTKISEGTGSTATDAGSTNAGTGPFFFSQSTNFTFGPTAPAGFDLFAAAGGGGGGGGGANICFIADTPVKTDQGLIAIQDIDIKKHTINNNRIVAITKSTQQCDYLIKISKNALNGDKPSQDTIISSNHKVYAGNETHAQLKKAKDLLHIKGVDKIPYDNSYLYNVLLEEQGSMIVNNMKVETLHPDNIMAKVFRMYPDGKVTSQQYKKLQQMNKPKINSIFTPAR